MTIAHDTIAAEIAALVPAGAGVPLAPLGYGTDLACADDITPDGGNVEGLACLAQDVYHWLITDPGTLPGDTPEEKSWGFGAFGMLHQGLTQADLANIGRRAETGLEVDDRISNAEAEVTYDGSELCMTLHITPAAEEDTFTMIVYVARDGSTQLELV